MLIRGSANEALTAAVEVCFPEQFESRYRLSSVQFKFARFDTYRVICDVLEGDGRVTVAIECFQQMQREIGKNTSIYDERVQWELSECYRGQCNQ